MTTTKWPWFRRAGHSRHIPNYAYPNHSPAIPLPPAEEDVQVNTEANPHQSEPNSAPCIDIRKNLDRSVGRTLGSHRLYLFIRRRFPYHIICRHSDRGNIPPSFEGLIAQLANDRELTISSLDIELCSRMEGRENFIPGNCHSQFESAGLCVEMPRGTPLPMPSPTTVKFCFGPPRRGRVIFVDPERLSPIGLSVLTWVLLPTEELVPILLDFMSKITFRNSLVELLTATNHTGEPEANSKMILLMRGWLTVLGIPDFVYEHGEMGHWATYVGKFPDHSETTGEEQSE